MSFKRSRHAYEDDRAHAPYVLYGTPLPADDPNARDDGSYVPPWQQEVTDERGRKRLHGAFTGGWSAGYFNTVGSKEGWTPSSFVSSRSDRARGGKDGKAREQRPEDFMDEEDLAEQAESQALETHGTFAGLGGGNRDTPSGGMFDELFRATGETMGVKLLQRMGWRPGQGIGPKVRRTAKGDGQGEMHLFAPDNVPIVSINRKTDRHGLGFAGEGRLDEIVPSSGELKATGDEHESGEDARIFRTKASKLLTKPKKAKKSGFGVGILNDTGSDDEDPYAIGPQIRYNRTIGESKKQQKSSGHAHSATAKPAFTSKKISMQPTFRAGFLKCHDGRSPLEGFVLSTSLALATLDDKYAPPTVPPDWKPAKSATHHSESDSSMYQSVAEAAKTSKLDWKARADLLGEHQLPGKSVFDFVSPAARERLAAASGKANLPPALGEGAPAGFAKSEAEQRRTLWNLIPPLDQPVAEAALRRGVDGWMPYAEDVNKRSRYKYFLELRAGLQKALPQRPNGFSTDEWAKELREFAQAAEVFKPMSRLMARRFTSSSASPRLASDAPDTPPRPPEEKEDPAEKAAKMGMYGALTRSRRPFYPTRLLCKRFGVRPPPNITTDPTEPDAEDDEPGGKRALDIVSHASLNQMMQDANFAPPRSTSSATEGVEPAIGASEAETRAQEVDADRNEALEGEKAGAAVFRAVFGSDSEDDG